ncbi:MAG: hypothetical protein CMN28_09500 [Salinisphaeraceae bacterium]|nr:hypothetical protein [Salinisphaeraceae bacterium]
MTHATATSKKQKARQDQARVIDRKAADAIEVMPERRDLHFDTPDDRIKDWHGLGPNFTQFMNTLSIFFPAGERMFIDAVRAYRDEIPDPDLKKAATAFIGQEAMHSREHIEYNKAMADAGLPAEELDRFVWSLLDFIKEKLPRQVSLNATIALEHFTALMGESLLANPEVFDGSQEDYRRMWMWHALEETEHKAVAFDVWEKTVGRGPLAYAHRIVGLGAATAIFWPLVIAFYAQMCAADEGCRKAGWRGHLTVLNTLLGKPGVFRKQIPAWLDYFKYSFHPWQHNNAHRLEMIDELVAEADAAYANSTKH